MEIDSKNAILRLVGENLRSRRLSLNLSQEQAAEMSGVSKTCLRDFENGRGLSLWGFICLCKTYGNTEWMDALAPVETKGEGLRKSDLAPRERASKRVPIASDS